MEIQNELTDEEVTQEITNSFPFDVQKFDFLVKYLKEDEDSLLKSRKVQITCFDVNRNFFAFGTSCGRIYCFRRHVIDTQQMIKYRLISSRINSIKLITDELLSFVTDSAVYVWNRLSKKFLYGWKSPTKAVITCLQTFLSVNDQNLLIISGDSDGCVRFHDLVQCQQSVIFCDIGYQIIQIEFIDSQTLLISTTFKTVIIQNIFSEPSKQNLINVGKNERKSCGKFGAVYSHLLNTIYGSRPSLHLIKAELNGNVIETIRVNNIQESECPQPTQEFIPKPITGKVQYKLGVLQLFCSDQYIISNNDSNLLIIKTDGQFCMKERIDKLIEAKISAANSNEAFLLLDSKLVIRIQNKQVDCSQIELSSGSDDSSTVSGGQSQGSSSDSKSSTESLLSLIKGPIISNPISFIDDELKKVFDFNKIQSKLAEKYNKLSTSILSTIDSQILPNSDKNVFVTAEDENTINERIDANQTSTKEADDPEILSPLVIARKGKRKTRTNGSDSSALNYGSTDNNQVEDVPKTSPIKPKDKVSDKDDSAQSPEQCETNDDNRLQMILSAYKEANNLTNNETNETGEVDNFNLDSDDGLPHDVQDSSSPQEVIVPENNNSIDSITKNQTLGEEVVERPKPIVWQQFDRTNADSVLEFVTFSAKGYNSKTEIGLIWFISKNSNTLLYYPSFECLKVGKSRVVDITCANTYDLFALTDSGEIYKREGMDATKPVGIKWKQIKSNRNKFKITSISFNWKDSILWCCDANGETWIFEIYGQKWTQNKDMSSLSTEMRKVSVSPNDCRIVWGLDKNGRIFVRSFSKSGDKLQQICGDKWLLMDGILATDIVVTCDNNVLIVVRDETIYKRTALISDKDRLNEWQPLVGPDLPRGDTFVAVSVTENNEIIAMTDKGSVWHTFGLMKRTSTLEDMDWLII